MNKLTFFLTVCVISLALSLVSIFILFAFFSQQNTVLAESSHELQATYSPIDKTTYTASSEVTTATPSATKTPQNNLLKSTSPVVKTTPKPTPTTTPIDKNKKLIALSFDDGPSKYVTPAILDILKRKKIKSTFCVLGMQVEQYPDVLKRAVKEGHEIVNHTYDHKNWFKLSSSGIKEEIAHCQRIVKKVSGYNCINVRPPYGNFSRKTLVGAQYLLYLWSVDPEDWKYRNSKKVINSVLKQASDGGVVLMHDIYHTTLNAVEPIINALEARGYKIVTVDELYKSKRIVHGIVFNP